MTTKYYKKLKCVHNHFDKSKIYFCKGWVRGVDVTELIITLMRIRKLSSDFGNCNQKDDIMRKIDSIHDLVEMVEE